MKQEKTLLRGIRSFLLNVEAFLIGKSRCHMLLHLILMIVITIPLVKKLKLVTFPYYIKYHTISTCTCKSWETNPGSNPIFSLVV